VTTPLDVLKTRLMTQGTTGRYKNLVDATLQVGFGMRLSAKQLLLGLHEHAACWCRFVPALVP
jgi:hypothetical protein